MSEAVEYLTRKADEWKAVGEEQTDEGTLGRSVFEGIEATLREVARALELDREEAA